MIQNDEGLNTSRMVANNGQLFIEDTNSHEGVWFGFTPGSTCTLSEITVTNADGDELTHLTDTDLASLVGTSNSLNSFCGAGVVKSSKTGTYIKGYITQIKLATGFATMHNDTMSKI